MNVPLEGVTIAVDGAEDTLRTVTDQFGNFRLEPAPAGRFFVHIDGQTATKDVPEGAYYPFVGKAWESIPGEEVNIGTIFLPLVVEDTLVEVSLISKTEITFPDAVLNENPELAGVKLMVPADALYSDDGTRGGMVGIAPVDPERLPGELPEGLQFPIVITVQTDGATNFDKPVPICFPNLPDPVTGEVLPPGAKSALFSFNHDTGEFEIVGPMTVSDDGRLVCTDPGVGILAPGWHGTRSAAEILRGLLRVIEELARQIAKSTSKEGQEPAKGPCDADAACKHGHSVYLHNGEEALDRVDLSIPGRGEIEFTMARRYRSQLDFNGPLGNAWNFDYNEGLFIEENGDVTRVNGNSHIDSWKRNLDGTYSSPAGFFSALVQEPDGTFVLREPNGFKSRYRSDGRLFAYEDRNSNRLLFDYDASGNLDVVIDPYGREIDFVFETFPDGIDRLVKIRDFFDREVIYTYDDNGDLVEVRTPVVVGTSTGNDFPQGRTERYTYSSGFSEPELNHNLLSVTYPEEVANGGPPALVWTYGTDPNDTLTFDKVLTETEGGTNASGIPAGGTMTFAYEELNVDVPLGDPDIPRGKAIVTERNGNQFEYFVNELNHHIISRRLTRGFRPDEPPFYETRSFYDTDGQFVRQVFPEGNEVRYRYGTGTRASETNLIETRYVADPDRGGGEDLVTTYAYEPLYNQMTSITGPRGNAAQFEPPIGAASPERYTTRYFFDYQEGTESIPDVVKFGIDISGIERGLGDLNGEDRLDQTAGNAVRTVKPAVQLLPDSKEAQRLGRTTQEIITEIQWNDQGQMVATIDPEGNVTEYLYYSENDPDGDGINTFAMYLAISAEPTGYIERKVVDARLSPRRTENAAPVTLETVYRHDPVGNIISIRNPRGMVTEIEVNQFNEPVMFTHGTDVSVAQARKQLLTSEAPFRFLTRLFYDHNSRQIRGEVENRALTIEGVGQFVEHAFTYDILDNVVASSVEVDATTTLVTQYRYDENELLTRITQPEGNEVATTYDERNLPFRVTRGAGSPDASDHPDRLRLKRQREAGNRCRGQRRRRSA